MREYLESSLLQVRKQGLQFLHLNLFEELLDMLQGRKLLDKAFELELKKRGRMSLAKSVERPA